MQLAVVLLSALGTVTLASPAFGRFGSIPDTPQRTNEAFAASPELNGTSDPTREERPAREIEGVDVLLAFQHQLAKDMEVMEAQGHGHLVKRSTRLARKRVVTSTSKVTSVSPRARTTSTTTTRPTTSPSATTSSSTRSTSSVLSTTTTSSVPVTTITTSRPVAPAATTAPASYGTSNSLPPLTFQYGTQKVRGVNLGGWLVLEAFIKPSMLLAPYLADNRVVDEYTLTQYGNYNTVFDSLMKHWSTWIVEDDLRQIAAAGLNHVRIPVGFWAIDVSGGEPYIQGSLYWLHQAVTWAGNHGLRVWIDIHGAPGSQNGFDNSGRRGNVLWHTQQSNVQRTENVLLALASEFAKDQYHGVVTSIQPLNEPTGYIDGVTPVVQQYYRDAYNLIRNHNTNTPSGLLMSIHDAFNGLSAWSNFMPPPQYQYVALDTHIYSMFDAGQIAFTDAQRTAFWCQKIPDLTSSNSHLWTIVGEWTPATTDCAGKLAGINYGSGSSYNYGAIGGGSRYDGSLPGSKYIGDCSTRSGSGANLPAAYIQTMARFFELQTTIYEMASGWVVWTWKMETSDEWSYQAGLKYGWIPQDPTTKRFGNQC